MLTYNKAGFPVSISLSAVDMILPQLSEQKEKGRLTNPAGSRDSSHVASLVDFKLVSICTVEVEKVRRK